VHAFDGGLELRPKNRGKSDVVQQLLQESSNDTPVAYLGDDLSDEEAFKTLGDRALKVLVREQWRPTLADVHLIPPDELLKFLDQWIFYTLKSAHV
jgi:trehalose-phosphatase